MISNVRRGIKLLRDYLNVTIAISECCTLLCREVKYFVEERLYWSRLSRLDFNITDADFEDLQAGYQPDKYLQCGRVRKGDW